MQKYINPYTDFGFKILFGEEASKDILIDFLNTFLPEKHRIKMLEFRNPEQLGTITADRKAIYDIFCEAENGERFIVEMQKAKQRWFKDRALFYTAFPIRDQAVRGDEWNFQLQAVYFIGILDFEYDVMEERRKFLRDIMLKDQDGEIFYDKLRFIFLHMPLFTKTESELETHRDKWLYFLKNLSSFDHIPAILRERIFERAFETAEIARLDDLEYQRYEAHLKVYRDNYAVMKTAIDEGEERGRTIGLAEGRAKGLAEGKAEGKAEEKIEIARNMKKKGLDDTLIAETTGLSLEEIDHLG
jgi:predicted transposase/invertase (TIGR01784 family)